jgi:hypothetical protein
MRTVIGITVGAFYLVFGIMLLIAAYRLNNPLAFILTFFASNLVILISAAVVVGLIIRVLTGKRAVVSPGQTPPGEEDDTQR